MRQQRRGGGTSTKKRKEYLLIRIERRDKVQLSMSKKKSLIRECDMSRKNALACFVARGWSEGRKIEGEVKRKMLFEAISCL